MKRFLFSYSFEGDRYSFTLDAEDLAEARQRLARLAGGRYLSLEPHVGLDDETGERRLERLARMMFATYDGEVVAEIPASLGFIARSLVFLRNLFRSTSGGKQ